MPEAMAFPTASTQSSHGSPRSAADLHVNVVSVASNIAGPSGVKLCSTGRNWPAELHFFSHSNILMP